MVLESKLTVPPTPPWHVARPRLTAQLDWGLTRGATVVTGVAAAGKTVLAAGWAGSRTWRGRIAWLNLDRDDNHPRAFWSGAVAALRRAGVQVADLVTQPDPNERSWLSPLVEALLAGEEPTVLVLDRFDAVTNREIGDSLDLVREHAAPALRLLVLARDARSLPLYRPRLHGAVSEITNVDLSFTEHEALALLELHGLRLPEDEGRRLRRLCEGWAGALRLFARAKDLTPGMDDQPARHAVAELLIREVFDAQSQPARDLLLRTSVLPEIVVELANRLTGRSDAQVLLEELARSNAFVQEIEAGRYRCHNLFRQALRAELDRADPGLACETHQIAARWFAGRESGQDGARWEPPLLEALTDRESQVLRCIAKAMSIRDVGEELYLSSNTVKTHLKSIYRKLAVNDRSQAARRARQLRLIEP